MSHPVMMAPPGKLPHPGIMQIAPGAPGVMDIQSRDIPAPGGPPQAVMDMKAYTQPVSLHQNQNAMKVHVPLAKARVLYIGTSVPTVTSKGLDAVQQPINDRYQTNGVSMTEIAGIDAWLTVFSSGVLLQYVGDQTGSKSWFPIHSLHLGTAIKCQGELQLPSGQIKPHCSFNLVNSPAAADSDHPPLFAAIMRRQTGVKTLECHVFICKSDTASMALVQSVYHAYEHKEGWLEESPPRDMYDEQDASLDTTDPEASPELPIFQKSKFDGKDRPPAKGYFLNAQHILINMFDVRFPSKLNYYRQTHQMIRQTMPVRFGPDGIPHTSHGGQLALPAPVPPPSQYFSDWDAFRGQPMAVFPGPYMGEDEYRRTVREVRNRRSLPRAPSRRPRPNREPDYSGSYEREFPRERIEKVVVDRRPIRRERVYDAPPQRVYGERVYDSPPARERMYDAPPARERMYDAPPARERVYDAPPARQWSGHSDNYYRGRDEGLDYVYQGELPASRNRKYEEPMYESRYVRHIDGEAQRVQERGRRFDFQDTLGYYP